MIFCRSDTLLLTIPQPFRAILSPLWSNEIWLHQISCYKLFHIVAFTLKKPIQLVNFHHSVTSCIWPSLYEPSVSIIEVMLVNEARCGSFKYANASSDWSRVSRFLKTQMLVLSLRRHIIWLLRAVFDPSWYWCFIFRTRFDLRFMEIRWLVHFQK